MFYFLYVTFYPFKFCNHLYVEERAGCFAKFVFLVSRDCCVALSCGALGCPQFVIVLFSDHTHCLHLISR